MENLTTQEKARRARERIIDELRRRGAVDVSVARQGKAYEIHATSPGTDVEFTLRTKTKARGDWQTSATLVEPRRANPGETSFWILEDRAAEPHDYHVVPDWWMTNYICKELASHVQATSTHCAIHPRDVREWRDRWDLLGLRV